MHPTIILATFLIATLALGLWSGKGVKTMKDYALANRSLGTGILTMTLLATFIGAGDMTWPSVIFNRGACHAVIALLSKPIGFLLLGYLLVPKMVYFRDCFTIGDIMHKFYGRGVRILSGFIVLFFSVLVLSSQLKAIGEIGSQLYSEISAKKLIFCVGVFVVLYTSLSGIRGVAYTDVLQFIVIVLMLLLLVSTLLDEVGGVKVLVQKLPNDKKQVLKSPNLFLELKKAFIFGVIPTFLVSPPIIQRILMVKNKRQVSDMFAVSSIVYFVIMASIIILGLGAIVYSGMNTKFDPTSNKDDLFGYLASVLFEGSPTIKTFIFVGIIFALSSTIDSFLHTAGVFFTHDVISPILNRKKIVVSEIILVRATTLIIGLLAIYFTLNGVGSAVSGKGIGYWEGRLIFHIIVFPMIFGVVGLKTDLKSFIAFAVSYISSMVVLKSFSSLDRYDLFLVPLLVGIICFFSYHIYQNKGIVMVERNRGDWRKKPWLPTWSGFTSKLNSSIPTLAKLREGSQGLVAEHGSEPLLFSIAFVVTSPIILLTTTHSMETLPIVALVYGVAIFLCSGLMIESIWASYLKPYFDLYWFITLLFCLPFSITLLFFSASNQPTVSIAVLVAFFLLMHVVDWKSFINLSLIGVGSATLIYRYVSGEFFPSLEFEVQWQMATVLFTLLIIGIIFVAKKELYSRSRLRQTQLLGSSIAHETRNYLGNAINIGEDLKNSIEQNNIRPMKASDVENIENYFVIPKKDVKNLHLFGGFLSDGGWRANSKISLFLESMRKPLIEAKREKTSIKKQVEESLKGAYFSDTKIKKLLKLELKDDFQATLLPEFFSHIMYNLVKNAYWHGGASQIVIKLDSMEKTLEILDNGRGISPKDQNHIFDLFYSGGSSSGIGLSLVKAIVESTGGEIHIDSEQGKNSYTKATVRFAS